MITATEGGANTIDLLFKNLMKKLNPDVRFVSSVSYLDSISAKNLIFGAFFCLITVTLIPLAVSGHFAVFLYALIVEKEMKTKYMMLMHGMNLWVYYLINYIFFLAFATISNTIFILASRYFLELPMFTQTSTIILFLVFGLFAHCQICLSILIQNFSLGTKIATGKLKSLRIYPITIYDNRKLLCCDFCVCATCNNPILFLFNTACEFHKNYIPSCS